MKKSLSSTTLEALKKQSEPFQTARDEIPHKNPYWPQKKTNIDV